MKKLIAMILSLVMCYSLTACGGGGNVASDTKSSTPTSNSVEAEIPAESDSQDAEVAPESKAIQVSIGDKIENDKFVMTLDSFDIMSEFSYRTSEYSTTSLYVEEGYKLAVLRGNFENISTEVIKDSNFNFEFSVNDSFVKEGFDVRFSFMRNKSFEIDPYTDYGYCLYIQVPDKLAEQFEKAIISIRFNEDMSPITTVWNSDGTKTVEADVEYEFTVGTSSAGEAPKSELMYYEEYGTLPTVDSIADGDYNGKTTTVTGSNAGLVVYKYTGKGGLDAAGLISAYAEAIEGEGFATKGSTDSEISIIDNETVIATIVVDSGEMTLSIIPENLRISAEEETIAIGDVITIADYEFTLKNVEFTYELLPMNTSSVYSSYPAESGKVYIHVAADVKNLMQRDIRIEELFTASALYDGKYTYDGFTVIDDGNRFDWVGSYVAATPLETCGAHCLIECPVEVDTSGKPVSVTLLIGNTNYVYSLR